MQEIKTKVQTPPIKDKKKKEPRNAGGVLGAIIFLIIIAAISAVLVVNHYKGAIKEPLSDSDDVVSFEIEEGSSVDKILADLVDSEILEEGDLLYLKVYLRQNDLGGTIQAGRFSIPKNLSMIELIETLQSGQIESIWVTLPEGLRIDEYAEILSNAFSGNENAIFSADKFMDLSEDLIFIKSLGLGIETETLEGFLFPDRYLFPVLITEEELIRTMTDNFTARVNNATYENIIIASLLEREGRTKEERGMISDIIRRRLNEGWFLNIDATLLYYHQDWTYELTVDDLKADHDYNTYVRLGYPPTPICNPGIDSINAAINPTSNNFYYYIHEDNGNIHYAVTLEEHTANINKYLQ